MRDDDYVYGYANNGWDDYFPLSVNPSDTFFYIAVGICVASVVGLPLYAKLRRLLSRRGADAAPELVPADADGADGRDAGAGAKTSLPHSYSSDRTPSPVQDRSRGRLLLRFVLTSGKRDGRHGAAAPGHRRAPARRGRRGAQGT